MESILGWHKVAEDQSDKIVTPSDRPLFYPCLKRCQTKRMLVADRSKLLDTMNEVVKRPFRHNDGILSLLPNRWANSLHEICASNLG